MMSMELEEIRNKIIPVLQRHDVKRAAIFGSFVREEQKEDSDIDILVEFKGEKSLLDLAGLKIELEEVLRRKVDVLTYNSLHPLLKDRILQEQKVIL
jgi:predicted nucleotidyltransferase